MISWSKYFNFNAEDVEYIEATEAGSGKYPYRLTVHLKSGRALSASYQDAKSRDSVRNDFVRQVDNAIHEYDMKILNKLTLLVYSQERIERRQLRIWRQLKDLLGISMEDE